MLAPIQHQLQHHSCATARQFSIKLSQLVSALHRHSLTSWETKFSKLNAQFKCLLRFSRTRNATAKDQLYLVNHLFSAHLVVLLQLLTRPLDFKTINATALMPLILTTEPTYPVCAKTFPNARIQRLSQLKPHLKPIIFLAI